MRRTPRSGFLPPDQQAYASIDRALPIGHGQTNSQPTTVRNMLRALGVRRGDHVLDVGSGSGWTTVLLARLVGPGGSVVGVERVPELTARGRAAVAAAAVPWARVEQGEADRLGWADSAPYQRVLVSAAASQVPAELCAQLAPGGVMVLPVAGRLRRLTRATTAEDADVTQDLGAYVFVPLVVGPAEEAVTYE